MQKYLNILNDNDLSIFKDIESLRDKIIQENKQIKVLDYGAGNPDDKRSSEQMYKGVTKNISTKSLCKIGLKNDFAHLIYAIIKKHQPATILELGTCCGFSSIYMSKALKNEGTIHTIEGSPQTAQIAQKNFKDIDALNIKSYVGRFSDVLPNILPNIKSIDFAFIDGHHDRDATLEYFKNIKPFLSENAIVLFDDISWSKGMIEAWEIIKKDNAITSYEDYAKVGLCFFGDVDDLV
ncbi:class I SAM-dependent methyltransferase [Sulfurimonas sp.]|uniref:O-methyltransferase n=1 Tax=Sulfurimonas sp. TaxID=2022749 RepID=UPI002AAF3328|nr:class I SAM-dependent methyltransferase [Sulfurimonas sp.]